MNTNRPPPTFVLQLQSTERGDDAVRQLRAALKVLLRRFKLRCVSVEERQDATNTNTGEQR
jgi:hypothetical protein